MKTAFFLALLANLTLLMYEHHRGAFDQAAEALAPDPAMLREPIVLAGEQQSKPPEENALAADVQNQQNMQKPETASEIKAATAPPAQQDMMSAAFACYEAGPFANEQVLKTWARAVSEVQGETKPVQRNAQEISDYLVLYPTAGSREDMKAAMQTLRGQGVSDAYPLSSGEYKGYISLGAFHRETQAGRMQKDLQGRGVEAVVKSRFKDALQKYAFFTGPVTIAERLDKLGKKYPLIQLKALPVNEANCQKNRSGQPANPVVEPPAKSETTQSILPENSADKSNSSASSNSLSGAENAPLKTESSTIQKLPELPVQPAQKPQKSAVDNQPAKFVCYEAGPFPNDQSLSAWQKQVAGAQQVIKPVLRDGKVISDYLVLYPSSGTVIETKANMQMLRERGIKDAWPLPSGDDKGQISLGVFNREENASQMQKHLLDKGVNSVVKPRYKSKRQKYALIAGPESVTGRLTALEKNYPDVKLRRMPETEQNCIESVQH
ncbi:MAG: hypothetical protein ACR65R_10680 [Methylomicrobium sp.]